MKFIISIALGITAGLVYGWVLNPVEYKDTTLTSLRQDFQTDYILMVAETFHSTGDISLALQQTAQISSESPAAVVADSLEVASELGYSPIDLALIQDLASAFESLQTNAGEIFP